MKTRLLAILLTGFAISQTYGQGVVIKGATVNITDNTVVVNTDDLRFSDAATSQPQLILEGRIILRGDLYSSSAQLHLITGLGQLHFAGTALQQIQCTAGTIIPVMVLSNVFHLQVMEDMVVSDTVRFIDGQILLQHADVTMGASAESVGHDANAYFNSVGGALVRPVANTATTILFPVGGQNYNPLHISVPASSTGGHFAVTHLETVFSEGTTGEDMGAASEPLVEVSWQIAAPDNDPFDLTLEWVSGDEDPSFDRFNSYVSQYTTDWNSLGYSAISGSDPFSIAQGGVSGSGVFGIGSSGMLLPMKWLSFSGSSTMEGAMLHWETAQEEQVSHYLLERSSDGTLWVPRIQVAAINGQGPFNYEVFDRWTVDHTSWYYRIQSVDLNGQSSRSPIIHIERSGVQSPVATISSTLLNDHPTITWLNARATALDMQVVDVMGRIIFTRHIPLSRGAGLTLQQGAQWPAGTYFVQVQDDLGRHVTFTVQNIPL